MRKTPKTRTFLFAAYTERTYYDVPARSEAEARALLTADPDTYQSGRRSVDEDETPYDLIDIEEA